MSTQRKELILLKICCTISVLTSLALLGTLFYFYWEVSYPSIILYKDNFDIEEVNGENFYTMGKFSSEGAIRISLNTSQTYKVILHEYSHYIYQKCMDRKDRQEWEDLNFTMKLETYKKRVWVEETFARQMENYLFLKQYRRDSNNTLRIFYKKIYDKCMI